MPIMYLDRDYRPRRRRRGVFGPFLPLVILGALAILFYQTRPNWLAPHIAIWMRLRRDPLAYAGYGHLRLMPLRRAAATQEHHLHP